MAGDCSTSGTRTHVHGPWKDFLVRLPSPSSRRPLSDPVMLSTDPRRCCPPGLITNLSLSIYRQDANIDPVFYWWTGEAPDRQGMNEIRHVTGMYSFWDELQRRHPSLLMDSCASGGRRLDFEVMRRMVALTPSDDMWDDGVSREHTASFLQLSGSVLHISLLTVGLCLQKHSRSDSHIGCHLSAHQVP